MSRDHALDTLRGVLLLMIAVNHFSSPLATLTYEPLGYVTGAEGFVLISGLVVGGLARRRAEAGRADFGRWARRRAGVIYLYHLAVVVAIFVLASIAGPLRDFAVGRMPQLAGNPWALLPAALGLLFQPWLNAILPLYCLLLVLAPVALGVADRRGAVLVLAASAAVWLVVQAAWPAAAIAAWGDAHGWRFGLKNPLAWQLLFVIGLLLGRRPEYWGRLRASLPAWAPWAGLVIAAGLKLSLSLHSGLGGLRDWAGGIDGDRLGWLRLADTLLLAWLIAEALRRLPPVRPNPLALLGRHSLVVFAFQIVAVYAVRPWFDPVQDPAWALVAGSVGLALAQFLPAWLAERRRERRRRLVAGEVGA